MQRYARIDNNLVAEIWTSPEFKPEMTPNEAFGEDFGKLFIECSEQVSQGWEMVDGELSAPSSEPPALTHNDLLSYAASKRYSIETGGFTYDGHPLATDTASQSKIGNGALAATVVGSSFSTKWKCSDGSFFDLDQAGMLGMATSVMNFINACFGAEAAVAASIASGEIQTFADVDNAAWP